MVECLVESCPQPGVTGVMLQEDVTLEVEPSWVGVLLRLEEGWWGSWVTR